MEDMIEESKIKTLKFTMLQIALEQNKIILNNYPLMKNSLKTA